MIHTPRHVPPTLSTTASSSVPEASTQNDKTSRKKAPAEAKDKAPASPPRPRVFRGSSATSIQQLMEQQRTANDPATFLSAGPMGFVTALERQVKEVCPDQAGNVLDSMITGIVEGLTEKAPQETEGNSLDAIMAGFAKERELPPPKKSAVLPTPQKAVASSLPEGQLSKASPESDVQVIPRRPAPADLQLQRASVYTHRTSTFTSSRKVEAYNQISVFLRRTYLNHFSDAEMKGIDQAVADRIHDAATAFVEAGCRTEQNAKDMIDKVIGSHRTYAAFASLGEAGYAMMMLTFTFRLADKLPADWNAAHFGTVVGAYVGYGMVLSGEAVSSVRGNHAVQLKPTGIDSIDKMLPSLLRLAVTAGVIGALCSATKNSTRAIIPAILGIGKAGLSKHSISNLDTALDTVGGVIFAAPAAAYLTQRRLYPKMKEMLPFQKDFPAFLKKFNEPTTAASASKALIRDMGTFVKATLTKSPLPSTLLMTGYITGMVALLLLVKHQFSAAQPKHPELNSTQIAPTEAAELGALSMVMMGILSLLAPAVSAYSQEKIDKPITNWITRKWKGENSAKISELSEDDEPPEATLREIVVAPSEDALATLPRQEPERPQPAHLRGTGKNGVTLTRNTPLEIIEEEMGTSDGVLASKSGKEPATPPPAHLATATMPTE